MATLLVIEDEPALARHMARYLRQHDHVVEVASDGPSGLEAARRLRPDLAIVDFQLPGLDGLALIRELNREDHRIRTVMVSGHANVAVAVQAMKAGSSDLLTKPVPLRSLKEAVDQALGEPWQPPGAPPRPRPTAHAILGRSRPLAGLRDLVSALAQQEPDDGSPVPPILFCGESGSGKLHAARAAHAAGPRAAEPFVEIDSLALHQGLDAEVLAAAPGGGTVFLKDVADLDEHGQLSLLHLLERRQLRLPRGGVEPLRARIMVATRHDLDALVRQGRFKTELLVRLQGCTVRVPPLRACSDDLPLLARHFIELHGQRYRLPAMQLSPSAEAALMLHGWPGNLRELGSVIERAVMICPGGRVEASHLLLPAGTTPSSFGALTELGDCLRTDELDRAELVRALEEQRWDLAATARMLQMDPERLQRRMDRHGLYGPPDRP